MVWIKQSVIRFSVARLVQMDDAAGSTLGRTHIPGVFQADKVRFQANEKVLMGLSYTMSDRDFNGEIPDFFFNNNHWFAFPVQTK
jgi:hypothetical protein